MKHLTHRCMSLSWLTIVTTAQLATAQLAFAQAPELLVELERDQIYEGESVRYTVMLNHIENPSRPQLEGFDDFDVQPAGERSFTSISNINGRRMERRGQQYHFLLTPKRAGVLEVPAPATEVDGRTIRGRPLTLEVIAPQDQDVAILEISVEPPQVYPMQTFTVRLTVAVKGLPDRHADADPLRVLPRPPALSIPWVADDELPEGVEAKIPWDRWIQPLIRERGGFAVNNIRDRSGGLLGSFFGDVRTTAFAPRPRQTVREDRNGRKTGYWEYTWERQFVSTTVGTMQFGPVTLKGTFATSVDSRGDLRGQRVYAIARPVTVELKSPPAAGKPDSYCGAIGQFTAGAALTPTNAKVGDPMTLTLWLRGEGTLDRATAPKIGQLEDVVNNFKVYEATEETQVDERRFTYSLRPKQPDVEEFPAISVAYFDVHREEYVTLSTDPISLNISPAETLSEDEITVSNSGTGGRTSIETSSEGIFANVTDLAQLRNESVHPDRWFLGLGGMAGVFLMLAVTIQLIQRHGSDPALLRRRGAATRAHSGMRSALQAFDDRHERAAADRLGTALIGLVADAFDIPESGLTSAEAARHLSERALDEDLIQRFRSLLDACDQVRYGASAAAIDSIKERSPTLLEDLISALRLKKLL